MGQAVSPFETMGRRKMRGDDEGGPWVAPLPRAGHACSCSRGKILLIILCPLYVRRAWCGVGSHAGKQAIGTLSVPCHADSRSQEPELALEVGDVTSQIPGLPFDGGFGV